MNCNSARYHCLYDKFLETNDMKRFLSNAAVAVLSVLVLAGCSKDGVKGFEGRYSYKISGKVGLLPTAYVNATEEEKLAMEAMGMTFDITWVPLSPEQGQMHVAVKDKGDGLVIVTFNDIFGNVCSAEGTVDSDTVTIREGAEKTASLTNGSEKLASGFITYGGTGVRYRDQLIISLEYSGRMTVSNADMTIVASSIECFATKN